MNLKSKALAAYNERIANDSRESKEWYERTTNYTRQLFIEVFGLEPTLVDRKRVVCDGYTLELYDNERWALVGECRKCKALVLSNSFDGLVGLGGHIKHFTPDDILHPDAECKDNMPTRSLYKVLRRNR